MTENFGGKGVQPVAETRRGNDAGASPDGISPYPIALFNRPDTYVYGYWGREIALSDSEYAVSGPAPFFLTPDMSSSDNLVVVGDWEGRDTPGIPVAFKAGSTTWGAMVIGNHIRHWNDSVVCEIPKGRVAFQTRIELKDGSPDAYATVKFKTQFPSSDIPPTPNEFWNAAGYSLNLNRLGHLELYCTGKPQPLFTTKNTWWSREWLAAQLRFEGVKLEIRTHNWSSSRIEIWLTDSLVPGSKPFLLTVVDVPSPFDRGPHFGYAAYTTFGEVRFNERVVCDMGLEVTDRYSATEDGGFKFDTTWKSVSEDSIALYSATQQFFAEPAWANEVFSNETGFDSGSADAFVDGAPQDFLIGDFESGEILGMKITRAEVDGLHMPLAYGSLQLNPNDPTGPLAIIHMNALPEKVWTGDSEAIEAQEVRLTSEFRLVDDDANEYTFSSSFEKEGSTPGSIKDFEPLFGFNSALTVQNSAVLSSDGNRYIQTRHTRDEELALVRLHTPALRRIEDEFDFLIEEGSDMPVFQKIRRYANEGESGSLNHQFVLQLYSRGPHDNDQIQDATAIYLAANDAGSSGTFGAEFLFEKERYYRVKVVMDISDDGSTQAEIYIDDELVVEGNVNFGSGENSSIDIVDCGGWNSGSLAGPQYADPASPIVLRFDNMSIKGIRK